MYACCQANINYGSQKPKYLLGFCYSVQLYITAVVQMDIECVKHTHKCQVTFPTFINIPRRHRGW